VLFKMSPFWNLFFHEYWMKQLCFEQNALFHFKENDAKTCQFPNQSLIFDLFNQDFNCNFDFKNQFNCIPVKFKCQPWSWLPFSL
jgi:hypothetical protein